MPQMARRHAHPLELQYPDAVGLDSSKLEAMIWASGANWGGRRSNTAVCGRTRWCWPKSHPAHWAGIPIWVLTPPRNKVPARRWHSLLAHELVHVAGLRLGSMDSTHRDGDWGTSEERIAELGSDILCVAFDWPYPSWAGAMYDTENWSPEEMYEVKRRIDYILTLDALTPEFGTCPIVKWTWPEEMHAYAQDRYPGV